MAIARRVTPPGSGRLATALVLCALPLVPIASTGALAATNSGCPAAESLVSGTTFHRHTLAPGVVMTSGNASDSRGTVNIHVLHVDLTSSNLSVRPLLHSLANRQPLSTLAAGHSHLVAAANTGYFDFRTGAPTVPLIVGGSPEVLSTTHKSVVGFAGSGLAESGKVWLDGSVTAGSGHRALVGLNEVNPKTGIAVYTHKWGSVAVPARGVVARPVVGGTLGAVEQSSGRGRWGGGSDLTVPSGGYLLVATGSSATNWLTSRATGAKTSYTAKVTTSAAKPFAQAYGVGVELVARAGEARSGFSCNSAGTKTPARTSIGFAKGGKRLVMAFVADHEGTDLHGLDNDQMSALMVQLGVSQAYNFDGSGSTELLAKLKGSGALTLQNYPADGAERPMPLGMGLFSHPVKHTHKH
ncbi:MAG TPA: phosphodiester glycosidase family protein [Mycobacteriales bacterium]|nr:phosphodiester glycosidase family protein [Mycobacteriales bacterium]